MAYLTKIHIQGLFGLYEHPIAFRRDEPVTIVAGPNGIGKTTLLSMTRDLCQGSLRHLAHHRFSSLRLEFDNAEVLTVEPEPSEDSDEGRWLSMTLARRGAKGESSRLFIPKQGADLELPPWIEVHGPDSYYDVRSGEYLAPEYVLARWGRSRGRGSAVGEPELPDWFDRSRWRVDFIETKRLDTLISRGRPQRKGDTPIAPIDVYLGNVKEAMEAARRESTLARQRLDRSFVRRLLARAQDTVNEGELRRRYSEVEALAEKLRRNGLLSETLEILSSDKLTPTNKRIINLFLDDFQAKLKPLEPVHDRLEHLRRIIDQKFVNKSMAIDAQEGIVFIAEPNGEVVASNALSSGEQHALALMSRLLFSEQRGTTVMIDEPELSLHVSWQHDILGDLSEIAAVSGLRFLLATHSTAIINNRWDLVEDLGAIDSDQD